MGDSRKVRFKVRGDTVRVSCNAQADIAMCVFSSLLATHQLASVFSSVNRSVLHLPPYWFVVLVLREFVGMYSCSWTWTWWGSSWGFDSHAVASSCNAAMLA